MRSAFPLQHRPLAYDPGVRVRGADRVTGLLPWVAASGINGADSPPTERPAFKGALLRNLIALLTGGDASTVALFS